MGLDPSILTALERVPKIMPRYGIDTSVFVRLLTGDPQKEFDLTVAALKKILKENSAAEIEVSNMVIAEAYFVLQHHYGVSKEEAKSALVSVMSSGLVKPQCGSSVLEALAAKQEPGLLDRLIAMDYGMNERVTLTHDRKMGRLAKVRLL